MSSRTHSSAGKSNIPINTTLVAKQETAQPVNAPQSELSDPKFNVNLSKISISSPDKPSQPPPRINTKLSKVIMSSPRKVQQQATEEREKPLVEKIATKTLAFPSNPPNAPDGDNPREISNFAVQARAKLVQQNKRRSLQRYPLQSAMTESSLQPNINQTTNRLRWTPSYPDREELKVSETSQNTNIQRLCSTCEKEKEKETLQAKAITPPSNSETEVSSNNQQEPTQIKDKQAKSDSSESASSVETVPQSGPQSGKSPASVQPPSKEKPNAKASPVAEAVKAPGTAQKNTQLPKETNKREGKQPQGEEGAEKEGQGKGKASANIPEAQALEQVAAEQESANLKPDGKGEVAQPEILAEKQQTQIASNEAQKQQTAIATETIQLASAGINFVLPQQKEGQRGENPEERARLEKQRAEASNLANNFLAQGASRVQTITALGQTIPARLKAAAENSKASLMAAVEQQKAMVNAQIEQQRAQVQSQAQTTIAQIQAQSQAALAVITQTTATNRQQVTNEHQTALQTVDDREKQQLQRVEELYIQAQEQYRNTGVKVGDEAISIGEAKAKDWESQIKNEDDSFLDGPLTDNRLRARAKAARDVAQQYKEGLIEEANKQADQLVEGKPKDIEAVHDIVSQARDNLQQLQEQTLTNLNDTEQQTTSQIKQAQTQLISTVNQTLRGTLQSLAQQKSAQLQLLSGYGQRQAMAIERDANKAIASIEGGVNEAADKLKSNLSEVRNQLDGTEAPPPDELSGVFAEILNQFDAAVAAVEAQTEQGTSASEQGINQGGQQAIQALSGIAQSGIEEATAISQGAKTTLTNLSQGASQTFNQIQQTYTTTVTNTVETALKGFSEVTQGVNQTFDQVNQNLERNFQQSNSNLEEGLQGALRGDKQPNLESDIQKYADEAAAQEQPRWKSVLKVVLIIAVIVVAIIVAPAVIGAVGAVAGALGASAAAASAIGAVVGGAIVGAVSGAVMQMGNNAIDGKNLLDGVGSAALAGAIGGALGGAGGALGQVLGQAGKLGAGLTQSALKFGIDAAFDIAGGIFGDLAVGNPITLEGVLIGAGIGAAVQISTANLGRLGRFGSRVEGMQTRTFQAGERFGGSVGGRVKSAFGGKIDVPTGSRPDVDIPGGRQGESLDVPGSRTRSGDVEEPTVKPEEPTVKSEETEVKAPETETSSGRTSHFDEPEIEPGVVAKEIAADGHEIKVLKDGRVVRCSDCQVMNVDQNIAQQSDPPQKGKRARENYEADESAASTSPNKKPRTETRRQRQFKDEVTKRLNNQEISQGRANDLLRYNELNPTGRRTIDEVIQEFNDGKQLGSTGSFYDPKVSQPPDFRVKTEDKTDIAHDKIEDPTLEKMRGFEEKRKQAKIAKEKAKQSDGTSSDEYKKQQQEMVNASEELGEIATEAAIKHLYPDAVPLKSQTPSGGKQGEFDQIYEDPQTGMIIIAEAKGGSSPLGSRKVDGGKRGQQGTPQYRDSIVQNMRAQAEKANDTDLLKTVEKIEDAVMDDKLRYYKVSQRVDDNGNIIPNIEVTRYAQ